MTGIFSIDNLSMDTVIIAGGDWSSKENTVKAMAITKDGGINWQLKENNPGYLSCIQFIPMTNSLVACSSNGIYYSEDLAEAVVGNEILPQLVYSLSEQNVRDAFHHFT